MVDKLLSLATLTPPQILRPQMEDVLPMLEVVRLCITVISEVSIKCACRQTVMYSTRTKVSDRRQNLGGNLDFLKKI